MNFFRTPFFLPKLYPTLLWRKPAEAQEIYLTFDDGPLPGVTEFVLSTLREFKAGATFFCIGDNIRKHPKVFKEIMVDGHVVGNHTFNHVKGWNTSDTDYVKNVGLCDEEIEKYATATKLFRPPYGRIKRSQIKLLQARDIVMWDVLTNDYDRSLSEDHCLRGSIGVTRPGSIVVFHDSLKAERNLRYALPRYLEYFSNLGYRFLTL